MSALPAVEAALFSRLATDAGVTARVGQRIYNLQAPSGEPRPYLVFYLASGLLPRLTARLDTNDVYRVEAVADTRAAAEALRGAVFAALDSQPLTLAGFSNYWLKAERTTTLTETRDGQQIWRYITDYRVRTSAQ